MKKKGAFIATISLALAITAVTACASPSTNQEKVFTPESSVVEYQLVDTSSPNPSSEDGIISPLTFDKTWSDMANNGSAVVTNTFTVNEGYGHLKLLMENLGSNSVSVSLTHVDTGLVYFSRSIPANGSLEWINFNEGYSQGMRGGNYKLQWLGSNYTVNGQYFGKLGSAVTDF